MGDTLNSSPEKAVRKRKQKLGSGWEQDLQEAVQEPHWGSQGARGAEGV